MAEVHADETAYVQFGTTDEENRALSFAEWDRRANQVARALIQHGVVAGDRVALHLHSHHCFEWIISYAGIHRAGAVMVPVNTRLSSDEVVTILEHAEPTAIITDGDLAPIAAKVAARMPIRAVFSVDGSDTPEHFTWSSLREFDTSTIDVAVGLDDIADIMYTSGTTGLPKGVLVRHRNVAMIPNGAPAWTGNGWLHGAPLFTFAGMSFVYNPMKMGLAGWYLPKFDTDRWFDIAEQHRPTMCMLVPAMAELLVASPRFATSDLSGFAMVSIGSAPLAPATLTRMQQKMAPASVTNSYGMTEAGPAYIVMPRDEATVRIGSVGRPIPPAEVKVVDPDRDTPCAPGEVGELLVRMPGKRREYYKDDAATAATWTEDGWLRTGDLAHLDDDGFVYISGRLKDMIIRGGNNIYATDVEAVLLEHPDIQEAAVVGVPHAVLGEDVGAFVVTRAGCMVTRDDVDGFCATRLADYKRPRHVWFVTELPRNATGKVLKHELRATAAAAGSGARSSGSLDSSA
jgi:acyl-CoA synthetase (AMP-forming)/AMP-acid ligase II